MALTDNSGNSDAPHLHFELRVNGTSVDPYAGATHWAGGDPFPMGYRDQNNAPHGPFRLNNPKIRDNWATSAARLGSPLGDDWSYICTLGSSPPFPGQVQPSEPGSDSIDRPAVFPTPVLGYAQRFERGYIHYCGNDAAQAVAYTPTFLPRILANENANAWNSTIYVRNLAPSSANVSLSFYRSNGKILDSRTYAGLPGNGTWEIRASTVVFDPLVREGSTFSGAALVAADQDVAVVVRTEKNPAGVLRVMAYTGVSPANLNTGWGQPGTTVYTPALYWHPSWTGGSQWESTIHVQNTTDAIAILSITYYDSTGAPKGTYTYTLDPYTQGQYQPTFWGNNFVGSAYLQANRPLAVVVTQEDISTSYWGAMQYNAFSAGSTKIRLPSLMDSWYNWNSSFTVQNLATSQATVQVTYYPEGGSAISCPSFTLASNASRLVCQFDAPPPPDGCGIANCDFPYGRQGTAVVTSLYGQNLVATVEQQLDKPAVDWRSATSYSGFIGGGATLHGPFAASHLSYDTCSHVQNVGSFWTSITSAYFYQDGTEPDDGGSTLVVAPGEIATFYVPADGVGMNFVGAVRITRSDSQIAGILNLARKPAVDDFGASYNLPQR